MQTEPGLTVRILERLKEHPYSLEELKQVLLASTGDIRAALYELLEARHVHFSNGRWRIAE